MYTKNEIVNYLEVEERERRRIKKCKKFSYKEQTLAAFMA